MRRLLTLRTFGVVVVLSWLTGPSFAQTNIGVPQRVCTTNIMCIINGVAYSPNTPKGYTCNNGYAAPVTTCHTASVPAKVLKPSGPPTTPPPGAGGPTKPPTTPIKGTNPVTAGPITGKPVEAAPTAPSHPVILEKGSGGGEGKH
jgi:hypothetical protein